MRSRIVDLRSDTVTQPTPAMRTAMAHAPVGDDAYGEDPTVRALEEHVAGMFGHQAGLWVPTGTMGNQIALQTLVPPGRTLVCDARAHIVQYECGGLARLGGITTRTVSSPNGQLDPDTVTPLLGALPFASNTAAVAVEQTHMRGGGTIQPLPALYTLRAVTRAAHTALHCDGARIWHAHIADQVPLEVYGRLFDTLSVCLSKALGAPAGAVILADRGRIAQARRLRQLLGGQLRQAGILAAAGLHAVRHHLSRLADDHTRARRLATGLKPYLGNEPATNIVLLDTSRAGLPAAHVAAAARRRGVLTVDVTPTTLRLVTHMGITDADVDRAADVLTTILQRPSPGDAA